MCQEIKKGLFWARKNEDFDRRNLCQEKYSLMDIKIAAWLCAISWKAGMFTRIYLPHILDSFLVWGIKSRG